MARRHLEQSAKVKRMTSEAALREVSDQLSGAGVAVSVGPQAEAEARRVVGLVWFADPSGLATEVFYGPMQSFDKPFISPSGVTGFVAGNMGLGHIVVAIDDLDESIAFYRGLLGMRISDYIDIERSPGSGHSMRLAFFHCNPRHHSIAFGAGKREKRLNHFMLLAQGLNDVGATFDRCQAEGVPIMRGIGRHTNDHMVSFYMTAPSGFQVEFG